MILSVLGSSEYFQALDTASTGAYSIPGILEAVIPVSAAGLTVHQVLMLPQCTAGIPSTQYAGSIPVPSMLLLRPMPGVIPWVLLNLPGNHFTPRRLSTDH